MLFFHACFTSLKNNNKTLQLFILCFHLSSICLPEVSVYLPLQCFTLLCYMCILKQNALWFHILKVKVAQSCSTLCDPMDSPWNSRGQNTGVGSLSFLQGNLPNPGIQPRSPSLQVDSLPAEPHGKPRNTGVGSLSLLQGIFPTQGLNPGLLHYRSILYQLSHKGSPLITNGRARSSGKYSSFSDRAAAYGCIGAHWTVGLRFSS